MSYGYQTATTAFETGNSPSLSTFWICDTDSSGTVNATFVFFDTAGHALSSALVLTATLPPLVPVGKLRICGETGASILSQPFPTGAVGALMTLDGPAYCSTSVDSPAGTSSDWRIEAGEYIPIGTLPGNIGISGVGNVSSGGGGGTEYAEDSAHSNGDRGPMVLAVRKDTAAATAADGDYVPLLTDSTGKLWVNPGTSGSVAKSVFEAEGTFTIATCSNALDINHSACSASVSFTDASSYAPSCIELFAKFVGNHSNAVAIGERVDLYWVDMNEGGTTFVQGGITTTDAAVVEPADTIVNVARLRNHYIGSAVFTTAAIDSPAYLSAIVNVPSPDGAIYYVNRSSQPLAASGHFIVYRPLNSVVV